MTELTEWLEEALRMGNIHQDNRSRRIFRTSLGYYVNAVIMALIGKVGVEGATEILARAPTWSARTLVIARELGITPEQLDWLYKASLNHSVEKIIVALKKGWTLDATYNLFFNEEASLDQRDPRTENVDY